MFAHDMLTAESAEVVVAGGMESMTNAPHLMSRARASVRHGVAVRPHGNRRPGRRLRPRAAARRWACSPKSAWPSTSSRASRWTISRSRRRSVRSSPTKTAASTGKWRRSRCRQGRRHRRQVRRAALQGQARQDPGPEGRVHQGRHDHRCHLVEHLRRRRRAGADAREHGCQLGCKPIARILPMRCTLRRRTGSPPRRSAPSRRC